MSRNTLLQTLTLKFLKGTLNPQESRALDELLRDEENARLFKEDIKDDYLFTTWETETDTERSLTKSIRKIQINNRPKRLFLPRIYRYAAALILLFGLAAFWQVYTAKENTIIIPESDNKIELTLSNGKTHFIEQNQKDSINGKDNTAIGYISKGKLSYKQDGSEEITFNSLHVPYGKQFELELSDGTRVSLNAGTTLRYPVGFPNNDAREVFLEGEAYFEVMHDAQRKFIVNTNELDVTVLGTEFNVTAYKEDRDIKTTLVNGSVQVNQTAKAENHMILAPSEQSVWRKAEKTLRKQKVDTEVYTDWREGKLYFKSEPFERIAKKLERSHDIVIEGYDADLGQEMFTAKFKDESIAQIIQYFSDAYGFDYSVNGNKITITIK